LKKAVKYGALCKYHNGTLDYYDFNTNAIYCKNIRNPPEFKGNSLMALWNRNRGQRKVRIVTKTELAGVPYLPATDAVIKEFTGVKSDYLCTPARIAEQQSN